MTVFPSYEVKLSNITKYLGNLNEGDRLDEYQSVNRHK